MPTRAGARTCQHPARRPWSEEQRRTDSPCTEGNHPSVERSSSGVLPLWRALLTLSPQLGTAPAGVTGDGGSSAVFLTREQQQPMQSRRLLNPAAVHPASTKGEHSSCRLDLEWRGSFKNVLSTFQSQGCDSSTKRPVRLYIQMQAAPYISADPSRLCVWEQT